MGNGDLSREGEGRQILGFLNSLRIQGEEPRREVWKIRDLVGEGLANGKTIGLGGIFSATKKW